MVKVSGVLHEVRLYDPPLFTPHCKETGSTGGKQAAARDTNLQLGAEAT